MVDMNFMKAEAKRLMDIKKENKAKVKEMMKAIDCLYYDALTEEEFNNVKKYFKDLSQQCIKMYDEYEKLFTAIK